MTSMGSMTLPMDFDIFLPCASLTMACRKTSLKGRTPMRHLDIITILATQKNKMS